MKKISFIALFIFFKTLNLNAQQQNIVVIDIETTFSINNVTVRSVDGKYVFHTNEKGIVNIRNFKKKDTLIFEHPDYETFATTKKDIINNKYIVELIKKNQKLDNVILSVSRTKNKKNEIARQVKVIDFNETLKIMPSTVADLLDDAGNILVQKTQGGAGSPIIRGLEANRVLLVIDGVRLNNAISRTGHLHTAITVNPLILDRTEIIYGPSSIYGSDALGGVINFYTKTPTINNFKKFSGNAIAKFASANEETSFHFNSDISFSKWASTFAFSYKDFGDIRMGANKLHGYKNWGIVHNYSLNSENYYTEQENENADPNLQPNTGFKQKDFFNKTIFNLGNDNELLINTQLNLNSEINRFDKLTETKNGKLKYAEWRYGPSKRFLISPQLNLNFEKKWLKKANIIFAYQKWEESRISRKYTSNLRKYQEENIDIFSFNADLNTHFSKSKILSYGIEATYNNVSSYAYSKKLITDDHQIIDYTTGSPVPTRYPDDGSTYSSFAAYTNYRFNIRKKSILNTGIRFTQTYVSVRWKDNTFITLPYNINELANFAFTGNISYIFAPKNWKFNTILSSGFRSPNVDDIGKIREKKGKVLVPNIYLKPEYAYNSEIRITRFFNQKHFFISINTFYSYLLNYIARDYFELQPGINQILYNGELADTYANVNVGNAQIYGGSFTMEGKLTPQLQLESGVFYTKGEMLDKQRPLPSIPPIYGNTKITYKFANFETAFQYKFMLEKPINEYDTIGGIDNIEETPINPVSGEYIGYPQWHIFNWYNTYYVNRNFSLNLGIENIFDIHYKAFASAISAPGRNIKIQITTHF